MTSVPAPWTLAQADACALQTNEKRSRRPGASPSAAFTRGDPNVRAQGWGDLLMEAATAWAGRWGASGLTLWLAAGNKGAWRFYQRHGFQPTGIVERWAGGEAMELYRSL